MKVFMDVLASTAGWINRFRLKALMSKHLIYINTLRPGRNRRHLADDILKCILLKENVKILIKFSLKCVPRGPINNIPALVQIIAWRRSGDKPLSEPMMVSLLTHICVTRPQWVNGDWILINVFNIILIYLLCFGKSVPRCFNFDL